MNNFDVVMILGLGLNLVTTLGGVVGFMLRYEKRLTAIETHILHILKTKV